MNTTKLESWICRSEGVTALTRQDIEAMQLSKLNALLARERERGGYYKGLPPRLASLGELAALPFTTPRQLAERGPAMVLSSQRDIRRVVTDRTSGTTGPGKRVWYSRADCQNTVEFFAAGLSELIFPGDVCLICMPFSGADGLGDLIARAVESLGASPLPAGADGSYAGLRRSIESGGANTFVGMPVPLLGLMRLYGPLSLRRALVSGDACPGAVLEGIEAVLGTRLFPHYGSREMGLGGAVTCAAHQGMHLRENHIIAEIIGPGGAPLPDGEWGELTVTTVGLEAMPLIRYRTGDRARILPGPCPCGGVTRRLDAVSRLDSDGMAALDDALFRDPELIDFSAALTGGGLAITAVTRSGRPPRQSAPIPGAAPVSVSARRPEEGDGPLYSGKRYIL